MAEQDRPLCCRRAPTGPLPLKRLGQGANTQGPPVPSTQSDVTGQSTNHKGGPTQILGAGSQVTAPCQGPSWDMPRTGTWSPRGTGWDKGVTVSQAGKDCNAHTSTKKHRVRRAPPSSLWGCRQAGTHRAQPGTHTGHSQRHTEPREPRGDPGAHRGAFPGCLRFPAPRTGASPTRADGHMGTHLPGGGVRVGAGASACPARPRSHPPAERLFIRLSAARGMPGAAPLAGGGRGSAAGQGGGWTWTRAGP